MSREAAFALDTLLMASDWNPVSTSSETETASAPLQEFRGSKFFPCTMAQKLSLEDSLRTNSGLAFAMPVMGFRLAPSVGQKFCCQKRNNDISTPATDFRQFTDVLDFSPDEVPIVSRLKITKKTLSRDTTAAVVNVGMSNPHGFRISSKHSIFTGSKRPLRSRLTSEENSRNHLSPSAEFQQTSTTKPVTITVPERTANEGEKALILPGVPSLVPVPEAEVLQVLGGHRLEGHVQISGAKNSALALLAGTVLASEELRICNVPDLGDIKRMVQVLESLGARVWRGTGLDGDADCLYVDASQLSSCIPPVDIVRQLRASFFLIGPLLARMGEAQVSLPGGCDIGMRPVELHLRGLEAMGAEIELVHGVVHAKAPAGGRLRGAHIFLDYPSVGATETLMMAATLAIGQTVLQNAAREPEVVDVANFCKSMGAQIEGAGTDTIVIRGASRLHGTDFTTIPDRIEAGTMLVAGAITGSEISMGPVVPEHLAAVNAKLEEMGCRILTDSPDILRIVPPQQLVAADFKTLPHPGFPTDMQPQLMSLLTLARGTSVISETVFESRLRHAPELARMGANIRLEGSVAVVTGVDALSGAHVQATDLRASAALILAGLAAEGTTTVHDLRHLDRGYEGFDKKLRGLGAHLTRVPDLTSIPIVSS